jgi:hypothetical protein
MIHIVLQCVLDGNSVSQCVLNGTYCIAVRIEWYIFYCNAYWMVPIVLQCVLNGTYFIAVRIEWYILYCSAYWMVRSL